MREKKAFKEGDCGKNGGSGVRRKNMKRSAEREEEEEEVEEDEPRDRQAGRRTDRHRQKIS